MLRLAVPEVVAVAAALASDAVWLLVSRGDGCLVRLVDFEGRDRVEARSAPCDQRPVVETPHGLWFTGGAGSVLRDPVTLAERGRWPWADVVDRDRFLVAGEGGPMRLHDLLVPLKQHGVSMTRFESRPAKSGQWEYFFFIDVQGHPSQPHVAAALADLQRLAAFYKVLGTYPAGD